MSGCECQCAYVYVRRSGRVIRPGPPPGTPYPSESVDTSFLLGRPDLPSLAAVLQLRLRCECRTPRRGDRLRVSSRASSSSRNVQPGRSDREKRGAIFKTYHLPCERMARAAAACLLLLLLLLFAAPAAASTCSAGVCSAADYCTITVSPANLQFLDSNNWCGGRVPPVRTGSVFARERLRRVSSEQHGRHEGDRHR